MEDFRRRIDVLHPPPHPLLLELEQQSRRDGVLLVSREIGRFLATIVTAMQASRILEIGTAYGYSTLWMDLAQPRMGKIWTVEPDAQRAEVALSYFRRAGSDDYIELFNTPAAQLLENFPHRNVDLVFVSSNKSEYCQYLELVIPMLKLSGLVVFADCLSSDGFAQLFLSHPALAATILPLGDGTAVGARCK